MDTARGPSRRAVLIGGLVAGAAVLAGCQGGAADNHQGAAPDPDTRLRAAAAADEVALLARYDATMAAHPDLTPLLAPVRAQHVEHQRVVGSRPAGRRTPTGSATSSRVGSPGPLGSPTPAPVAVPSDRLAALRALGTAESAAAAQRADACVAASRKLAPLLGSVAASESSHAAVLALAAAAPPATSPARGAPVRR